MRQSGWCSRPTLPVIPALGTESPFRPIGGQATGHWLWSVIVGVCDAGVLEVTREAAKRPASESLHDEYGRSAGSLGLRMLAG